MTHGRPVDRPGLVPDDVPDLAAWLLACIAEDEVAAPGARPQQCVP